MDGIEKLSPEHHPLASEGLPSDDIELKRQNFLSHPLTNFEFFFLLKLPLNSAFLFYNKLQEVPEYV